MVMIIWIYDVHIVLCLVVSCSFHWCNIGRRIPERKHCGRGSSGHSWIHFTSSLLGPCYEC